MINGIHCSYGEKHKVYCANKSVRQKVRQFMKKAQVNRKESAVKSNNDKNTYQQVLGT